MLDYIIKFKKYKSLLYELVLRDLKIKYRRSLLGYLWSLLNPLLMMMVVSTVFSYLFRYEIPNYAIYLLAGQIMFGFFSEATNLAMMSVLQGGELIKKVYIPKYIFPLSRILSSLMNFVFSLGAIIIMLMVTKTPFTFALLLLPLPLVYIFLFALGIGLILSAAVVYFRDIIHLYSVALTAWMYLTPIFYPESILPLEGRVILSLNPMHYLIKCFREIVVYGQVPSLNLNIICFSYGIISIIIGLYIFKKSQDKFILYI